MFNWPWEVSQLVPSLGICCLLCSSVSTALAVTEIIICRASKSRQRWLPSVVREKDCLYLHLDNPSLLNTQDLFPDFSEQASVPLWLLTVPCSLWRITCVQLKRYVSGSSCVVSVGLVALWSAVLLWRNSKLGIPNLGRFSAVVLSSHSNFSLLLW